MLKRYLIPSKGRLGFLACDDQTNRGQSHQACPQNDVRVIAGLGDDGISRNICTFSPHGKAVEVEDKLIIAVVVADCNQNLLVLILGQVYTQRLICTIRRVIAANLDIACSVQRFSNIRGDEKSFGNLHDFTSP